MSYITTERFFIQQGYAILSALYDTNIPNELKLLSEFCGLLTVTVSEYNEATDCLREDFGISLSEAVQMKISNEASASREWEHFAVDALMTINAKWTFLITELGNDDAESTVLRLEIVKYLKQCLVDLQRPHVQIEEVASYVANLRNTDFVRKLSKDDLVVKTLIVAHEINESENDTNRQAMEKKFIKHLRFFE